MNLIFNSNYLSFSDTAKYADVARNLLETGNWFSSFTFFYPNVLRSHANEEFLSTGILPLYSYILSIFYKIFGMSDATVIITSTFFFILTIVFVFLLASKLSNKLAGFLSSVAVLFSPQLIDFAKSGASESLLIFEILLGAYVVAIKKSWSLVALFLVLFAMYFTRPQAFIYMMGLIVFYLFLNFKYKKALFFLSILTIIAILVDLLILSRLEGQFFLYSILSRGADASVNHLPNIAISEELRGAEIGISATVIDVIKKLFYNLYNFYKALPEIINPYLFALFAISLFKKYSSFTISVAFMTIITLLVTALTIPFYRYIHPVIPFVYIIAVGSLVEIIRNFVNKRYVVFLSLFLVLFFGVGQTLGILFLDSRFERKMYNTDKPPVYAEMSYKLKEITSPDQIVLTNLDTWGSWYGERKTIWFPLKPEMIQPVSENIDAIYLTSYKMDDENYYMGEEWREIFNNPKDQKILPNYKFVGEYEFKAEDNYENENGRSVLLIKK